VCQERKKMSLDQLKELDAARKNYRNTLLAKWVLARSLTTCTSNHPALQEIVKRRINVSDDTLVDGLSFMPEAAIGGLSNAETEQLNQLEEKKRDTGALSPDEENTFGTLLQKERRNVSSGFEFKACALLITGLAGLSGLALKLAPHTILQSAESLELRQLGNKCADVIKFMQENFIAGENLTDPQLKPNAAVKVNGIPLASVLNEGQQILRERDSLRALLKQSNIPWNF
jgi:hypothetical protein